ncbi:hypothetical protein GKZ68_20800 (plasmid) [Hymenobacter sp. BRD128]|uniref:hypothetical protein n=1 Tax=Hymenobacter sp. BRD128 TaxID=2675878 RepID=UPI001563AD02|nr:hypothetical protein [Hymenobacter sp. BRD128]QKG59123.1 hypothetical protein GKZ68_20800 [Hymenobacter sp. BRD128]
MQFDLFAVNSTQPVDLRSTKLPDLAEAAAQVGTVASWQTLTLSQVLELWDQLYTDFVASLQAPIEHARCFCQEHGKHYGEGGPGARKFYQREYERLVQGQQQLQVTVENLFCANMLGVFAQGKEVLKAGGLDEDEAEESNEFFNAVFQHPEPGDLGKLMPVLMRDLAQEYQRLQAR